MKVSHDRPIDGGTAGRNQKSLQCRRARGLPYRDNRGLSHGFVLDDESLDLTRINVDPSDNLGVVGAAAVGNPPVAVDTHPVPRVEPTLIRDGGIRPIPIALSDRRSADP
ncbi:Uncharacterised protein [Mycobacterium tuberculosis]|uniref:Uncharacterized protein n=1 Tax=Mycobacterium tuberculosis TaxID=1773 RepID=A0A0U0QX65_MYCTX|nr:Uncharacterised protein [Mycobacterium tuberculosis]COV53254.1 Uncharacterised protein [Mycobacterium tuberculosis]COW63102.1 Uncharacterised protein [Mycobacterium tuberculosis]